MDQSEMILHCYKNRLREHWTIQNV